MEYMIAPENAIKVRDKISEVWCIMYHVSRSRFFRLLVFKKAELKKPHLLELLFCGIHFRFTTDRAP